jgi:hypothetical protein
MISFSIQGIRLQSQNMGKEPITRIMHRWEDNIKMVVKETVYQSAD